MDIIISRVLTHQVHIQDILSDNAKAPFLGAAASAGLQKHIDGLLMNYTILANDADAKGLLLWNLAPKFHFLWHMGQRSAYLNPRRGNTMIDESFVGVVKEIVRSCVHGTEPHKVPMSVMANYQWGLHFLATHGGQYNP